MTKIAFNHTIDEKVVKVFEELYEILGPPKNRILEACIEAFSALPREVQYRLKGQSEQDRKFCLDLIRALRANPQSKKRARQA